MRLKHNRISCFVLSIIIFCCCFMTACSTKLNSPVTVTDFKLNTFVLISAYTTGGHSRSELNDILNEAIAMCDYYENIFSRTRTDSTLYMVNTGQLNHIPKELGELIETGLYYAALSNGAFDISIGSVSNLWDFSSGTNVIPDKTAIDEALLSVDYRLINLSKNDDETYNIQLPEGTQLDLGALAKGYIADKIKQFLLSKNIDSALINLGGNVLCVGSKNSLDFTVAIKKPFGNDGETIATLGITDKAVVSSGNYERYFYADGTLYHHILSPFTGFPHNNNLTGVTIISDDSTTGDSLSTTCFMLGLDKGLEFINNMDGVEAMFVDTDGVLYYSDNFTNYLKH